MIEGRDSGLKVCMGYRMLGYASAILSFFQHAGCSGSDHDFWLQIVMVSPGTHLVNKS